MSAQLILQQLNLKRWTRITQSHKRDLLPGDGPGLGVRVVDALADGLGQDGHMPGGSRGTWWGWRERTTNEAHPNGQPAGERWTDTSWERVKDAEGGGGNQEKTWRMQCLKSAKLAEGGRRAD